MPRLSHIASTRSRTLPPHDDGPAPGAVRLAGPLSGRVDAHLGAEPGDRRREVEVVDRGVLDEGDVADRVHPGRERPRHVLPVAGVDVLVHHDDDLGVHELAEHRPQAEHHPFRVSRELLPHRDDADPVRAPLGGQVEVADLGELAAKEGDEELVHGRAEDGRLVGRAAGVGAVVDGVAAVGDALDGEDRERLDVVVVPGVVPERALRGLVPGMDGALEHDLRARRHLEIGTDGPRDLGAPAPEEPRERVLGERVRDRGDRGEGRRRVRPEGDRDRERLPRPRLAPRPVVESAPPVREPAHDDPVARDDLLAVDAEVLPAPVRPPGDDEGPGDERPRIVRPAGLYRPRAEVHRITLQHHLPARRGAGLARGHREDLPEDGKRLPRLAEVPGRVRLAEEGEELADLAKGLDVLHPHRPRDPAPGPEEVGEHRDPMPRRPLEEKRGAAAAQGPVAHRGHLEAGVDLGPHPHQIAGGLEARDEVPEVPVAVPRRRGGGGEAGTELTTPSPRRGRPEPDADGLRRPGRRGRAAPGRSAPPSRGRR